MPRFLVILCLVSCGFSQAAEIRIQGLRTISEKEALSRIGNRLEFVKERPASASRADDAAYLLEKVLEARGYSASSVRAEVRSPALIVLHADEGRISTLGQVQVRGVDTELGKQLANQFEAVHNGKSRKFDQRVPYLAAESPEGVANATTLLQSMGYWDAKVTLASANRNPGTGVTDVSLDAVPGPLYHLAKPSLSSGGVDKHKVEERLAGLIGEEADTKNITRARNRVERIYRDTGYQNAKVEMRARHEKGLTHLSFEIIPGKQYTVGTFTVDNEKGVTKPHRISNRFRGVEGTIYDADDVNGRLKKLFATGAFSGLRIDEDPHPDGTIDLTLHAKEGKADGYFLYAGAGSYEGGFIGGGYYNRNILGNLWNFTSALEMSGIGLLGNVGITDPFFLETDLRFTALAYIHSRNYEGWKMLRAGLGAELDWQVTEHYLLKFRLMNSYVTVESDGIPDYELGPTDYVLMQLGVTQIYDRRNDKILPTKGFYASLATDMGFAGGSDSIGYMRADGKIAGYYPVTRKSNIAAGIRGGIIIPSGDEEELPIDLRFFTGGQNSVRSFEERDMGPKASNGDPLGGKAYWVANLEYIQTVKGPIRLVAFVDAGTLSSNHSGLDSSDVKVAVGLGARIDLPIGPIRFEYGHSLTQDPGDPSGTFHFAIGATF